MNMILNESELLSYVNFPEVKTEEDFTRNFYDKHVASGRVILYAILDKTTIVKEGDTQGPSFAGVTSFPRSDADNARSEVGIMLSPRFHRTHVSSNAIGLLLLHLMDPPSLGGQGLRRVEWQCHADNEASRRVATRMGFEFEGILRWHSVLPRDRIALPVDALEKRNGTTGELLGRHSAIFSIVWDEWDQKRPIIVAQMERKK